MTRCSGNIATRPITTPTSNQSASRFTGAGSHRWWSSCPSSTSATSRLVGRRPAQSEGRTGQGRVRRASYPFCAGRRSRWRLAQEAFVDARSECCSKVGSPKTRGLGVVAITGKANERGRLGHRHVGQTRVSPGVQSHCFNGGHESRRATAFFPARLRPVHAGTRGPEGGAPCTSLRCS